jgi:hypothetical protein
MDDDNRGHLMIGWACIYTFCCMGLCAVIFLISQCKWINP